MNKQKQILVLILIIVAAVLVWLFVFKLAEKKPAVVTPVTTEEGKFVPKLNNTLETSVTVVNPNEAVENPPSQ